MDIFNVNYDKLYLSEQEASSIYNNILSEKDFYPPEDKRKYRSYIYDIHDGDNFEDYAKDFFKYCEESGLYE